MHVHVNVCVSWYPAHTRSDKERGLHARAGHCGAGLPCKISYVTIPLKENVDDPSFQLVEWPIILPEDFVSERSGLNQFAYCFLGYEDPNNFHLIDLVFGGRNFFGVS